VALHSLGFTETQIQFLLRLRYNVLMTYLRNLAVLAEKQTQALDAAGAMPHFLKLILLLVWFHRDADEVSPTLEVSCMHTLPPHSGCPC
jgi:hypothetical protein